MKTDGGKLITWVRQVIVSFQCCIYHCKFKHGLGLIQVMLYSGQKEEEKKNVLYVVHAASIEE